MSHSPAAGSLDPGPALRPATRWRRDPRTLWRAAGDTIVLLPDGGDGQTPLTIHGSAALLWELLARPVSLAELASELAAAYGEEAEVIAADLAPALDGLLAASAVERCP
jgi:hypothetical protein